MDLYCQRCGEPWDQYGVYNGDMTAEEKHRFLKGIDCPSCHGKEMCKKGIKCQECNEYDDSRCRLHLIRRPFRAQLAAALTDVLGDDTDGLAAEMEDAEWMLGSEFWD